MGGAKRACAALALATAGCAAILGGNDGVFVDDGGTDAGHDTFVAPDTFVGVDAAPPDDSGDSSVDALADVAADAPAEAAACPGDAGPVGVRAGVGAGGFCIDRTEVTNAEYQAFLTAKGSDAGGQPATCAWNATYTPTTWPFDAGLDNLPVVQVNWCDAYAYCAWAGKRLCGAPDGGATGTGELADAAASQWFAACSHGGDGLHAYPYGAAYDPAACNGIDANDAGTLADAASRAACVGGYGGIFDMSGNAREWEDACDVGDGAAPQTDSCRTRGGAVVDDAGALACAAASSLARNVASAHTGFRCCSQ